MLPIWVSVPVLIALPVFLYGTYPVLAAQLEAIPLAALPVLVMLAVFLRLNQAFPQPRESRWHAFVWGAVVAGTAAGFVNGAVAVEFGEVAARVGAAPIGEEVLKGLGIVFAVRRGEITNRLHGATVACWIAAGFTFAEEIQYLAEAVVLGDVASTFFFRGVFGSFAHPIFTIWIGLAIGAAVERARPIGTAAAKGLIPAILLHAIWNGTQLPAEVFLGFLVILVATTILIVREWRGFARDHGSTAAAVLRAATTVGLPAHRMDGLRPFLTVESARERRCRLPRSLRPQFDTAHASIARALSQVRRRGSVTRREIEVMSDYAASASAAMNRAD